MTSKTYSDRFIDWVDSTSKKWSIGIIGLTMIVSGPIVAATFRTPPGVALLSLGSVLIYFLAASLRRSNATKLTKK